MVCPFQFHAAGFQMKTVMFCCDLCPNQETSKGDITRSEFCRQQFIQILPFFDSVIPCQFNTNSHIISIPTSSVKFLKEYGSIISKYENRLQEISRQYPEMRHKLYSDPIRAYLTIEAAYRSKNKRGIREFISALEQTQLISQAKSHFGDPRSLNQPSVYETLLKVSKTPKEIMELKGLEQLDNLVDSYDVGPFNIRIFEFTRVPLEKYYQVLVSLDESLSPKILRYLFEQQNSFSSSEIRLQSLDELLHNKILNFQHYLISHFDELTEAEQKNLAMYATVQSLNLAKTIPLLLDDEVQEVYLDKPGTAYYLDHARWGRCKTNLLPLSSELSHFITRLRLESRKPLDEKNPSLKTELKTSLFHVRAAVDIPPLAHEGSHINIRKIRMRTLTLPELIRNGTLSLFAAAFLILSMSLRINITICGEPATGKTTLANAINLVAPPSWRRIAIEDALESVTVNESGRHKVTFKVDPFDSLEKNRSTKSNEIIRLLHRSPDWVFLGELQTAEHSEAMFHAISAGIRGIQTCHANSNTELLLRWQIHHDIPEVCFQSLGLLVHMVREVYQGQIIRRVTQISEVKFQSENSSLLTLFEWNKSTGQLEQRVSDIISPVITRASKYQQITELDIHNRFESYRDTLARLVSKKEHNPSVIVSAFDKAHARLFLKKQKKSKTQAKKESDESETIRVHQIAS